MKLSPLKILRLWHKNQINLELCHQWRMRTDWDPINVARIWWWHAVFYIVFAIAIGFCFILAILWSHDIISDTVLSILSFLAALSIAIAGGMVAMLLPWSVPKAAQGFGEAYAHLLFWVGGGGFYADKVAKWDFIHLRRVAKDMLILAATCILDHEETKKKDPADLIDTQWALINADLHADFRMKYRILQSLGLVTNGYNAFFKEAKSYMFETKAAPAI